MKKVLVISYAFPPIGGGGVQRSAKFVKYLRKFNWNPVVLTVANPSVPTVDEALFLEIPKDLTIYKAFTLEPSYAHKKKFTPSTIPAKGNLKQSIKKIITNLMLPDIQILWWPGLALKLIQVLRKEKPNCIFVTAPPFSSFVPVVFIGNIFKIPVVLDFRDEWAYCRDQMENLSQSLYAIKIDRYFEKYCVSNSVGFTAASESYVEDISHRYNLINKKNGLCITNGFDEDDFKDHRLSNHKYDEVINVVFSGTVWKGTSLKNFIFVLEKIISNNKILRKLIKIKIFGRIVDSELEYFQSDTIRESIEIHGYIDHKHLVKEIMAADILLMAITDSPGANKIILGKTFEYMATGKHIFALIPNGESKRLLHDDYGNVTIVDPGNIDGIYNALFLLIENIDSVRQQKAKDVSRFSRKLLSEKLAIFFDRVSAS